MYKYRTLEFGENTFLCQKSIDSIYITRHMKILLNF